jgi:hypothetical protein
MNTYKRLGMVFLAIVMLLLLFFVLTFVTKSRTIETGVQFFVSPSDAVVKINGVTYDRSNTPVIPLTPGSYSAEVIRVDFQLKTVSFEVKDTEIAEVPVLLSPLNDTARQFLESEHERTAKEMVSYRLSVITSQKVSENTPITKRLPVNNSEFRIDYGVSQKSSDDPTKVAIYITTDLENQRTLALDWIRKQGFNPDELEIYYRFFD